MELQSKEIVIPSKMPKTQGRKGFRQKRINMAYTPENYEFLQRTARQKGLTMTAYMNQILDHVRVQK